MRAARLGPSALLAAFLVLIPVRAARAGSPADACREMELRASQNMSLYHQQRDSQNRQAAERFYDAAQTFQNHARQCWAAVSYSGEGGIPGGGGGGGGNRLQQGLGILQQGLGLLRDIVRQREERRRRENHRLADEANEEGKQYAKTGDCEEAIRAYDRALSYLEANGDGPNSAIVIRNRQRCRDRLWLRERLRRREQNRIASLEESEKGIAGLAAEYKSKGGGVDCTAGNYDPKVCNFGANDPIWKNIRTDVKPDWCVQNGGTWNGLAQYCVISPERAAAAPPPEPREPGKRYYLVKPVEEKNPFLLMPPVRRENCSGGTCIYRNVSLADCRRLGGLPYARPADQAYSGHCAIHGSGGTPLDISLHRAPRYTGKGPAEPPGGFRDAYSEPKPANPWGDVRDSTVSGSPTERGGGRGVSSGGTGPAK